MFVAGFAQHPIFITSCYATSLPTTSAIRLIVPRPTLTPSVLHLARRASAAYPEKDHVQHLVETRQLRVREVAVTVPVAQAIHLEEGQVSAASLLHSFPFSVQSAISQQRMKTTLRWVRVGKGGSRRFKQTNYSKKHLDKHHINLFYRLEIERQ